MGLYLTDLSPRITDFDSWEMTMNFELSLAVPNDGVESIPASRWEVEVDSLPTIATLGLSLAQAKAVLVRLQAEIVKKQIGLLTAGQRMCIHCGSVRKVKACLSGCHTQHPEPNGPRADGSYVA